MLRLLLCLSLVSFELLACTEPGSGFLPENNLKYPVNMKTNGLTREQYDAAIDKFVKVYSPIVTRYGARLEVSRQWENERVNAGTLRRDEGKTWVINLYGGFARHPELTPDGYMLVICHELGHHIGGAPKKRFERSGIHWASTEGQSDYFATLKCLRKVFASDNNAALIKKFEVPESVRTDCARSFSSAEDIALCIRTSIAGISVGKVNASIRKLPVPDIEVVDSSMVEATANAHPVPQCRLNTYYQGSLCPVSHLRPLSQVDEVKGTCHKDLMFDVGLRPSCWYRSK